uniref:Uncharacterized protein n=1 Tax=viral metagenome TaxID=1070528 RepID=A0A6C0LEU0_9ZZZZ
MLGTKLLLEQKISGLQKSKRRDFLLNCIEKNKVIKFREDEEFDDKDLTKKIAVNQESFCKICNKYEFIKDKYSETCQSCGYDRPITATGKKFEKIEYIKPGANLVKIMKDSKKITVDLNKINQWLQDTDPLARDTQKIIDNLNIIFQTKGIELPNNVQNTSISLWYNFNSMFQEYSSSLKKLYNKKAILSLCVFYGALIHGYTVSLEQLSILFNINVTDITTTNSLFKDVFKNTDYYKYLNLHEQKQCNIQLSPKNKLLFQKIKNDIIKNFSNVNEPLQSKEFAAIIYFITNKINTIIKFTLKDLEEKCNISTTSISYVSKSIEKFYKNNPKLYKELLI